MTKKLVYFILAGLAAFFFVTDIQAASSRSLKITGAVKQPLHLTIEDIRRCQSVHVQLNEIMRNGEFRGVFEYQGVPLKTLLELASVYKKTTGFSKPVDLAILIKNRQGRQVTLSWGEVFYRNRGEIIVAHTAFPIFPHKDCKACHDPDIYEPWLNMLKRKVEFPKLVVAGDTYADRSLEEITDILIVDLSPGAKSEKIKKLFSSEFKITGKVKKPAVFKKISHYPLKKIRVSVVGEGKGYHGIKKFTGTPLVNIIKDVGIKADLNTVFLLSAPDGYRSLLSYGELFLSPLGDRTIIANRVNEQPIEQGGRFCLIIPDDQMADRWVKAVQQIDVIENNP